MGTNKYVLPDPALIPEEHILPMLIQLAGMQSSLAARLIFIQENNREAKEIQAKEDGELLTAEQAATILSVSPDWMYRHAPGLPFTKRLSRKAIRFSKSGLLRWRESRRG
jgi:hypothetical protein